MFTGPDVKVIDGLLPADVQQRLIECVSWMPLHFQNRWDRFKSHELDMHWYYPLVFAEHPYTDDMEPALLELDSSLQPVKECWDIVKRAIPHPVRLYECMLGANTFGTEGRVHHDIAEEDARAKHYTVLVYVNREWQLSWAGETLFFDDDDEVSSAVVPRPGRVVIAIGDAQHVGRSVSRICPVDRRVLVFKLWNAS